jgi:hypothetical protein
VTKRVESNTALLLLFASIYKRLEFELATPNVLIILEIYPGSNSSSALLMTGPNERYPATIGES